MPNMFPFDKTRYGGNIAFGGGGGNEGGGGTTQTVEKADPWEGQQPYLTFGFEEAKKQFNNSTPTYFPKSTIVPFAPETELALNMQTNRAINGSPIQRSAVEELDRTMRGDYLGPIASLYSTPQMQASNQLSTDTMNGKYLYGGDGFNAAFDAASRKILPQVNSAFERAGRTGSGLAAQAQTQALGDAFANLYGQERNNQIQSQGLALAGTNALGGQLAGERENQLRSMFFAPSIAEQDFANIAKLGQVGAQREGMANAQLTDEINRWNFEQGKPQAKLADYMGLIQGNYGGSRSATSTVDQPSYSNDFGSAMGGMLALAGMMSGKGGLLSFLGI